MNYSISISEPWDCKSSDGKHVIKGEVIAKLNDQCLVFKVNYLLEVNDLSGFFIVLSPRSKQSNFKKIEGIDANGGLLAIDYKKDLSEKELKENSKFVLIGAMASIK